MIDWLQSHIPPWAPIALVVHLAVLGTVAYLILLERKVASWVQDRIGPNRVGLGFGIIPWLKDKHMFGLGQPLADGMKFIFKEDYRPRHVDRILFTIAPIMMIIVVIISIAVIPWGGIKQSVLSVPLNQNVNFVKAPTTADLLALPDVQNAIPWWVSSDYVVRAEMAAPASGGNPTVNVTYRWPFQIADLNIGVLFVLATLSLAVYGVVVGGWASNNKYSFLGGLRATANMISYEIPLGLAVLSVVVLFGTLDLGEIVDKQAHYWAGLIPAWNAFCHPVAFLLFLTAIHAEANRAPFDVAEAEQELVGGYHTEYSSMRFALFFLAEYAGMITTSAVCVALFLGGWHLPWIEWLWPALAGNVNPDIEPSVTTSVLACVVRFAVFFGKTLGIVFIFMWTRWSLPRFRFDQIMMLAWRALIPISLALLMVTGVVVYLWRDRPRPDLRVTGSMALALIAANVVLVAASMAMSLILPPAPETNRKLRVAGSRYARTPLPRWEAQTTGAAGRAEPAGEVVHAGAR